MSSRRRVRNTDDEEEEGPGLIGLVTSGALALAALGIGYWLGKTVAEEESTMEEEEGYPTAYRAPVSAPPSSSSSSTPAYNSNSNSNTEPIDDAHVCKICYDAPMECVLLPCQHQCTCLNCAQVLTDCPICRTHIKKVIKVFKA